jgi:hypothetical protein
VEHAASYWRPASISLVPADRRASVTFYGYHDRAARHDGKSPIATKQYSVADEAYDGSFGAAAQSIAGNNPQATAYALATSQEPEFWAQATDA